MHDDAAERVAGLHDRVAHRALVALDVQLDARGKQQVLARVRWIGAIVGQCQERATQGIEMSDSRCAGVG